MNSLSKSNKLKAFFSPKMTYIITFLDNRVKLAIYTGVNIHVVYPYIEIILAPNKLTSPVHSSHHFGTSSSTKTDTETLQSVISYLRVQQNTICECSGYDTKENLRSV